MNTQLLNKVESKVIESKKLTPFSAGDTIAVKSIIREGDKQRTQTFTGIVIAIKGSGIRKTFTIRKISFGIGVEKIIPLYSPNIESIELIKKGKVRRSKLYYMRNRIGRQATKIKSGKLSKEDAAMIEEMKKTGVIEGEAEVEATPAPVNTEETSVTNEKTEETTTKS